MTEAPALRLTPQRQAVLDVLRAATDHPTAAEVFERVRRVVPGIGAATVYRTLGRLVQSGQARELTLGDGTSARYDGTARPHQHVVCDHCGRAVDVDLPVPDAALAGVAAATDFVLTGYDLQFRGVCAGCRAAAYRVPSPSGSTDRPGLPPEPPASRPTATTRTSEPTRTTDQ